MKRKAEASSGKVPEVKRSKVSDYVEPKRDSTGDIIWPASTEQIIAAKSFIKEWWVKIILSPIILTKACSASAQQRTLIVPDKDADGLSAGVIVHRTLVILGLDPSLLTVHLVQKGSNIHEKSERQAMAEMSPKYVIVVDQGSRAGPPVIDSADAKCMIIDHHLSDEFPKNSIVCCSSVRHIGCHLYKARLYRDVTILQWQRHL
jgi:hypothetical protein